MISLGTVKFFLVTFGPIFLPRIIAYYRSVRASSLHQPSPRPLPQSAHISLNVLFTAALAFFLSTLWGPSPNIFTFTSSRPAIPTDVLFTRLALLRSNETLTATEELLRERLTTPAARSMYFHYGPNVLASCLFCDVDEPKTYLLYALPRTLLPPHLLHLAAAALATSAPIVGPDASIWRNKFTISAIVLVALDIYTTVTLYDPTTPTTIARRLPLTTIQTQFFWHSYLIRYLVLTTSSLIFASLVYLSTTNKLPLSALFFTPQATAHNIDQQIMNSIKALNDATAKLHTNGVSRNAVSRNQSLRQKEEMYWETVTRSEENTWDREEVVDAVKNVLEGRDGEEGIDITTLAREAETWVNAVTNGLED